MFEKEIRELIHSKPAEISTETICTAVALFCSAEPLSADDEREHCYAVAVPATDHAMTARRLADLLILERAAARAEGYIAGINLAAADSADE